LICVHVLYDNTVCGEAQDSYPQGWCISLCVERGWRSQGP
jgi:hypothetical protein